MSISKFRLAGLFVSLAFLVAEKSSLVNDILVEVLRRDLNGGKGEPGDHDSITGIDHLDKMIAIDQSPIGRTPRSNPGTYIKVLDDIRKLYAEMPEAKRRGYKPGRFSFNVKGGRCEACEGNGSNKLEMDFLADVWVTCTMCEGHRFNRETLQVRYRGKSISDVLEMDVQEALEQFENIPAVAHKLQTLHDVGLDYIKLGQPSPTLSGGEAQRIKLAKELVKKSTGGTLYILDEPTTGLHFADVEMLLKVLHNFTKTGNTVLVVEHNLDVVKTADWVIDMGPEGGAGGGQLVIAGTPEEVAAFATQKPKVTNEKSGQKNKATKNTKPKASNGISNGEALTTYTGIALAPVLSEVSSADRNENKKQRKAIKEATHIIVQGARQHNLRDVDLKIPRDAMTVCCGPSGSGKSSMAMDTIYAEGQRRYVESLSSYARQFVGQMQKPALEHIEGLSPAIAIEQRNTGHTPRSTVGTVTEIYDYFRILFARLGQPYCPDCDIPIGTQTADEIVDKVLSEPEGTKLYLMAPVEAQVGEKYETLWDEVRTGGYTRVRIDGVTYRLEEIPQIDRRRKYNVEVVVDRIVVNDHSQSRITESVEAALALGGGVLHVAYVNDKMDEKRWEVKRHSRHRVCEKCSRSFTALAPHHFSFNSQLGWCKACEGLGTQTGANPAALLKDSKLTLAQGALLLWPNLSHPMAAAMLQALAEQTGVPLDLPYERLTTRHRRILLHGTEDLWITVPAAWLERTAGAKSKTTKGKKKPSKNQHAPSFAFQFKGLYPALEEAAKLSPALRNKLEHLVDEVDCGECGGSRLRDATSAVRLRDRSIEQICKMPLAELHATVGKWKLNAREKKIAGELLQEITNRLTFLIDVGLDYLTIGRGAPTLSGGESQRIRLASQVGSGLCGVLYVLDEPTIGLHPRDNKRLISALHKLRDLGNTLLVVEHDREVVESADALIDFGPAAGRHGGYVVAEGTPAQVAKKRKSVTGPYLSGKKGIPVPTNRRMPSIATFPPEEPKESDESQTAAAKRTKKKTAKKATKKTTKQAAAPVHIPSPPPLQHDELKIIGARHNNLKNIDVAFPLGTLTAVAGVSGSGKSSLIEDILFKQLSKTLHRARSQPGKHDAILGLRNINKVIRVDQQPLGNSPKSNPATYTGVFEVIRNLFAQLPEAKLRGYPPRRFSFNVPGGRCDACEGAGQKCIEMHFLPNVWVECETCKGKRYNPETLGVRYRGRSIADVLELPCGEALALFEKIPKIARILQTLCDVGLDYVTLGQPAPTLSGGEAQRVKLAAELSRPDTGRTLYLLDEPTTGLHFSDLEKLLEVMHRLVDLGNTVVVIEHNLDILKNADWVIEIGPEAGAEGGYVVAEGTPEDVIAGVKRGDAYLSSENNVTKEKPKKKTKKKTSKTISAKEESTDTENALGQAKSISPTAFALAPVLAAGPHKERKLYDPFEEAKKYRDGLDISEVGDEIQMPWEANGEKWHTKNRVGRDGTPCTWDGEILAEIESRIHQIGTFSPTNWNARTIVEISALKKSEGWFMHAITGEKYFVRLKFRMAKNTFSKQTILDKLRLPSWNDLEEIPHYGRDARVKCKNLRGPFQEVQIDAHSFEEIDTPEFWAFLEKAVTGFQKFTARIEQNPEDVMPWKVLGQKWHLARKGFPPGKKPRWKVEVLEKLIELLSEVAPDAQFLWNSQQVIHIMAPQLSTPWVTLYTKRLDAVTMQLVGTKGIFTLGSVAELGVDPEVVLNKKHDETIKLLFRTEDDLASGDLLAFLYDHLQSITPTGALTSG